MRRTWVKKNDVLLNITGASIGRTAIYFGEDNKANVNQHVCIIRLKKDVEITPTYLNFFLSSKKMQDYIWKRNAGATRQALNFSQIGNFDIPIPSKENQEKFTLLVNSFNKITHEQKSLKTKVKNLNDSVLHKAMSGQLKC